MAKVLAPLLLSLHLLADPPQPQLGITPIYLPIDQKAWIDLAKAGIELIFPEMQVPEKEGAFFQNDSLARQWLELSAVLPRQMFNSSNENSPLFKRDE